MLQSVKLQKRQSEIRQELAVLAQKDSPSEDEVRSMSELDTEYQTNETRYRAALVAEDEERREAGEELETRSDREYQELIDAFEMRQIVNALDDGSQLSGQTAEVVTEMRQQGSYQGLPVPLQVLSLEQRAGETIASGTPDPIRTKPIIDQLFPASVAARMGVNMITIDSGAIEWPVATQGASVGWGATETGDVGSPQAFQTVDRPLKPEQHMGAQMVLTRKSMKQSGSALEQAIRRDMNSAIAAELDRVVFLGTGADGQPLGIVTGAGTYGFDINAIDSAASYAAFRASAVEFMVRNAANSLKDIRVMFRHELLNVLDGAVIEVGSGITEFDFVSKRFGSVVTTGNALAAPTGSPVASKAVLTTSTGGVPPFHVGVWSGLDVIRDPYSKAASGQLVLTGLLTMDVTASRTEQVSILTGLRES